MGPYEVWKYEVTTLPREIEMPADAVPVHVGTIGDGRLFVWAIVDPSKKREKRTIQAYGTGEPIPGDSYYIGTCVYREIVWHVWEHQPKRVRLQA